jgi:hypothetical protein
MNFPTPLSDSQLWLYQRAQFAFPGLEFCQQQLPLGGQEFFFRARNLKDAPKFGTEALAHQWLEAVMAQGTPGPKQTEGTKHDSGKPMMDLLDPLAMEQLAKVLTFGAQKYAAHNWRKGIKQSRLIAALLRHTFAHMSGQNLDEESGLPHIAHAMCCCMFLLGLANRQDLDDRFSTNMPVSGES